MRRLLFATLALLAACGTASASWFESPVTLTLTLSSTGDEQSRPGMNDTSIVSAPLQRSRFGNAHILAALVAADIIPETKGWRLVIVWEGVSNDAVSAAYAFHARRGQGASAERVRVPSSILTLEPRTNALAERTRLDDDGIILSGSEKFEVYGRLAVDTPEISVDLGGILVGSGRYVQDSGPYLLSTIRATLQGLHHVHDSDRFGAAEGSITIGPAKWINNSPKNSDPDHGIHVDTTITVSVN